MRKAIKRLLLAALLVMAAAGALLGFLVAMPGDRSPQLLANAPEEARLQAQLLRQVSAISGERNYLKPERLEAAAQYIESELRGMGYQIHRQAVPGRSGPVRNIEVRLEPAGTGDLGLVVIGAHYDSAEGTPAANDNGSGVAVLLELARAYQGRRAAPGFTGMRLVFYANEEPPYFETPQMGSWVHAADLKAQGLRVAAMYSLETMGAYYDAPGTQKFPVPGLALLYPDRGNFIGFIGTTESRALVRTAVGAFRETRRFPSEGIAAPGFVTGVDWSDHWSYAQHGYTGVMVTDTAPFRYPHYHTAQDTPDRINYAGLAKVTLGLREMLAKLYLQGGQGA